MEGDMKRREIERRRTDNARGKKENENDWIWGKNLRIFGIFFRFLREIWRFLG